jgi:predicted DCC family thiol-disulfide oxidoreductase YuxK
MTAESDETAGDSETAAGNGTATDNEPEPAANPDTEKADTDEPDADEPDADEIIAAVDGPILLFDGVCNLCNETVRFVVDHDSAGHVSFAPLQSPVGRALLEKFDLPTETLDSVVLVEGDDYYRKSDAAVRVARYLDGPWQAAGVFSVVPRPLRDIAYNMVAEHRYRVFGRKESCPIPDPETRKRFLDGSVSGEQ